MANLGDICSVRSGYAFKSDEFIYNEVPVIRIGNITVDGLVIDNDICFNNDFWENNPSYRVKLNDILIALSGATVGKSCQNTSSDKLLLNQRVAAISCDNYITLRYIFHAINSARFMDYVLINSAGCAQPNISIKQLSNFSVPNKTECEQKKIVNILDKLDKLINLRKQQLSKLDELVKSRFIEMFGEPLTNSKGWKTECLFSVAPTKQIPFELSGKVWLLNLDAVESNTGTVLFKNIVSNNEVNASTVMFSTDNVLYSKLRPYLNKVVLPDDKGVATSELLPFYPDKTKLNRVYLCYWLRNDAFVKHISEKVAGAKMPRVSMDYFRSIDIELPPIDLQNQFAEFVEQTDKSKLEIKESLEKLETLKKSLMQKYFG